MSRYNCFGYGGHFHILEKRGASLEKVSSVTWSKWLSGLWHCDQSPLGNQLNVEIQLLPVTFGSKTDNPNAVINIGWVSLFPL